MSSKLGSDGIRVKRAGIFLRKTTFPGLTSTSKKVQEFFSTLSFRSEQPQGAEIFMIFLINTNIVGPSYRVYLQFTKLPGFLGYKNIKNIKKV
jgi:hypothetical protein